MGGIANLAEALEAQDVPQTTEELIGVSSGTAVWAIFR